MYTKGDVANQAFEELRISGLTVDPTPEDMSLAVRRLDAIVNGWKNYNICLGYNESADPIGIDPGQEAGTSDNDFYALVLNLAKSLAPAFGKTPAAETLVQAKIAYEGLFSLTPVQREGTPYQPMGSGSRSRFWYGGTRLCIPNYQQYIENSPTDCEAISLKTGQTKIFELDYSDLVPDGATLSSFESSATGSVSIDSISETDAVFTVELTGGIPQASSIKITLTFSNGEVNPVTTFVDVSES